MFKYLVIVLLLIGCKEENSRTKKGIASTYDGGTVTIDEIDNYIKDELYEQLFAVYYLRNVSLDEVVVNKLFFEEAKKRKMDVERLLNLSVYSKLSADGLSKFCKKMNIDSLMQDPKNPFSSINVRTEDGKKQLWERYKKTQLAEYGQQLLKNYHVQNMLVPPIPPKTNLDSISFISLGNSKSKINFWIFSDFDCSSCRAAEPVLEKIYLKYKDKVEFRYTALTDVLSFSTIACECAAKQDEFKNLHDFLYSVGKKDSTSLMTFLRSKDINFTEFSKCTRNSEVILKLSQNLNKIKKLGILQTPSIYIDDRTYYGQIKEDNISLYLESMIRESNK